MKKVLLSVVLVMLLLFITSPLAVLAKSDGPGHVSATDIEIVKKVTLKGPAGKGGKPVSFAATGTVGASLPSGGEKYAIVIGINDYPGTGSDLEYCVKDANEVADVLTGVYGFSPAKVKLMTDTGATYEDIKSEIETVVSVANSDDEVVFFFSGHGAKNKANDGDSNNVDQAIVVNKTDGSWGYVWDGELQSWFSDCKANRIIFIFDSCLSGGMAVLQGGDRVVNMACSANGLSYEGDGWGGGHGQFTYYFVEAGMHYMNADVRPDDNKVTVEEAFDYARSNCQFQSPVITDGFKDDLLP